MIDAGCNYKCFSDEAGCYRCRLNMLPLTCVTLSSQYSECIIDIMLSLSTSTVVIVELYEISVLIIVV